MASTPIAASPAASIPYGNKIGTAVAGSGAAAINMFTNPVAVYNTLRSPILGIDSSNGGNGPINGLPYWNMDMSITKSLKVFESYNMEFSGIITNIFNHNDFANPTLSLATPNVFGVVNSQGNNPRQIQLGVRANF